MEKKTTLDISGQPVCCSNKEALEEFNKGLTEYVLVQEDCALHFQKALQLDDSMTIIHALMAIFCMSGMQAPTDPAVAGHLAAVKSAGDGLSEREKAYSRAALAYASGSLEITTTELATMLFQYPRDALGIRLVVDLSIGTGEYEKMRDIVGRALPFWSEDMPLYHGILACYGFALEECREREKAEEVARKALSINKRTPFATHAMAHIFEEGFDPRKGVEFLTATRADWSGVFEGHLNWHLLLYYLDIGELDTVLKEFDTHLRPRAKSDNLFGLLDASSLLWRLEVMGIDPGEERWELVTQGMTPHIHNHRSPWFDAHIMFSLARGKVSESAARLALAQGMIKSLQQYTTSDMGGLPNQSLAERLGLPVCNALLAFGNEKYDEVIQIMLPLRYEFLSFGGSWAQRQVFSVTLIQAAIRANNTSLALGLVAEIMAQKPNNPRYPKLFEHLKKKQRQIESPAAKKIKI